MAQNCCTEGWYVKDVPVDHPDFAQTFICDCPKGQAIKARRLAKAVSQTRMTPEQEKMTFDTFYPEWGVALQAPEPFEKSYPACRQRERWRKLRECKGGLKGNLSRGKAYSQKYAQAPQFFFTLLGEPGCGKTHLAAAIANFCASRGMSVCFAVVPDLLDAMRATFQREHRGPSYEDLLEAYRTVDLLILDDMGTQYETAWAAEKIYQIINYRYNWQMAVVITTNEVEDHLDGRLRSRIFDRRNQTYELLAGDFRMDSKMRKAA